MSNRLRQMKKQAKRWHEVASQSPQTRMAMNYRCDSCGRTWKMWLQTGLEEHGENHKPVPFAIRCKCGGTAFHFDWILDEHLKEPIPITGNMSYFANKPDRDCGVPVLR